MPAAVQKQSSMTQVRLVFDVHGRKCEPRGTSLLTRLGQQLSKRRPRAKRRFRIPGRHRHLIAFHSQRVALLPQVILRGAPNPIRLAFLGSLLPRELRLLQPRGHDRHVPPLGPHQSQGALTPKSTALGLAFEGLHDLRQGHEARQFSSRQGMGVGHLASRNHPPHQQTKQILYTNVHNNNFTSHLQNPPNHKPSRNPPNSRWCQTAWSPRLVKAFCRTRARHPRRLLPTPRRLVDERLPLR